MWGLGKSVKIKYGSRKPIYKLKTGVFVVVPYRGTDTSWYDVSGYVTSGFRRLVVTTLRGTDASWYRHFGVTTLRGTDTSWDDT